MTPLLTALSSLTDAARIAAAAASALPASAASRNLRTDVFSSDLTALLRIRAFSFCLLRLIWDLMFATRNASLGLGLDRLAVPAWTQGRKPGAGARTGNADSHVRIAEITGGAQTGRLCPRQRAGIPAVGGCARNRPQ